MLQYERTRPIDVSFTEAGVNTGTLANHNIVTQSKNLECRTYTLAPTNEARMSGNGVSFTAHEDSWCALSWLAVNPRFQPPRPLRLSLLSFFHLKKPIVDENLPEEL